MSVFRLHRHSWHGSSFCPITPRFLRLSPSALLTPWSNRRPNTRPWTWPRGRSYWSRLSARVWVCRLHWHLRRLPVCFGCCCERQQSAATWSLFSFKQLQQWEATVGANSPHGANREDFDQIWFSWWHVRPAMSNEKNPTTTPSSTAEGEFEEFIPDWWVWRQWQEVNTSHQLVLRIRLCFFCRKKLQISCSNKNFLIYYCLKLLYLLHDSIDWKTKMFISKMLTCRFSLGSSCCQNVKLENKKIK